MSDGAVETILTDTGACDPVRRTAWGTILVGEEAGPSGQLIEILNPLGTHFVVSVQHSVAGHGVILDITGWR